MGLKEYFEKRKVNKSLKGIIKKAGLTSLAAIAILSGTSILSKVNDNTLAKLNQPVMTQADQKKMLEERDKEMQHLKLPTYHSVENLIKKCTESLESYSKSFKGNFEKLEALSKKKSLTKEEKREAEKLFSFANNDLWLLEGAADHLDEYIDDFDEISNPQRAKKLEKMCRKWKKSWDKFHDNSKEELRELRKICKNKPTIELTKSL